MAAEPLVRLKFDSKEYDAKIERARKGIIDFEQSLQKASKTFKDADDEQIKFAQSLGNMQTVARTTKGQIAELTKAYTDLRLQYNRLSDEDKNSEFGKGLASSLERIKERITETKEELNDVNKELGNTTKESNGASGALDELAGKFGLNIKQLAGWGAAVGAATAALQVAKNAFFQSESNIDEWGRTLEGAKGAYSIFLDTINGGNWSNFFDNLGKAIQGGRDLYDAFDRLNSIKANNQLAIATVQAQIQQLRVLKQQGQNVDAQIKAASERLRSLQMESVSAGKLAGARQLATTVTNRVNAISGSGILSAAEIGHAVASYERGGQSYIDQQKAIYERLAAKGSYQYIESVGGSVAGSTQSVTRTGIDLSLLTAEEQKQYIIAKAITEGETELQQGLATITQAVQEEAASWQQQFRNNRYEMQGSRGGSGGGGTTAEKLVEGGIQGLKPMTEEVRGTTRSRLDLQVTLKYFQDMLAKATTTQQYQAATSGIASIQKQIGVQQMALQLGIDTESLATVQDELTAWMNETRQSLPKLDFGKGLTQEGKNAEKSWQAAAQAVNAVGGALQNIEDPSVKIAGLIGQAIANIALGFAQATSADSKLGVFGWIGAIAGGLATMVSTIAAIHNATGYSEGGIVQGRTYSNDQIPAMLNAGEVVLTRAMAGNLASQLQGGGLGNLNLTATIQGEQIRLALNNNGRRTGRGEYVTSKSRRY